MNSLHPCLMDILLIHPLNEGLGKKPGLRSRSMSFFPPDLSPLKLIACHEHSRGTHRFCVHSKEVHPHISPFPKLSCHQSLYLVAYLVAFAHFCIFLWKLICENFLSLKILILIIYISLGKYPFHLSWQLYLHRDQQTESRVGGLKFLAQEYAADKW